MSATTFDPVPVCSALADETRWQILRTLGDTELSASELAQQLPVTRQAIARHLHVLADAGLVEQDRVGKHLRFRALGSRLSAVAGQLDAVGRAWETRLATIKQIAEGQRP